MSEWDALRIRIEGDAGRATLIYLPGIHGDWTLASSFRAALGGQVRFVEFTYPRTSTWTIRDHARAILDTLAAHEIREGWILAESFGSVLAWAMLERAPLSNFRAHGVILSGGFVRYPYVTMVKLVRFLNRAIPLWLIKLVCWVYGRYAVLRHRKAPETLACVSEFVRRRSEEADRQAICYRYDLILQSDARELVKSIKAPLYQLCGLVDPIVPWLPVRLWLRRNCANYKGWRFVWRADHNVLGTAPQLAAEQVVSWMGCGNRRRPAIRSPTRGAK